MKLNRIITLCAMAAAMTLSTGNLFAQDNGGGNGGGIQQGGGNGGQGGQGGQRRNRQQGGGNFDPAQMQQRLMDNVKDQLEFTNDDDWAAVQPLVQKVLDAYRDAGQRNPIRALFNNRNRGGGQGGGQPGRGGGMFGTPSPEQEALQNALEENAPAGQVKDLLAKYKTATKAKQAKLEAAQADLKAVLTTKQEAQAYLLGLVN
jgi:hypothetical protein